MNLFSVRRRYPADCMNKINGSSAMDGILISGMDRTPVQQFVHRDANELGKFSKNAEVWTIGQRF